MFKVETVYENDEVGIEDCFNSLDDAIEFYNRIKEDYFNDGYDYITLMEFDEDNNLIHTIQSDDMNINEMNDNELIQFIYLNDELFNEIEKYWNIDNIEIHINDIRDYINQYN